jgi:hypothetical protein
MTQIITSTGGVSDHSHAPFQRDADAAPSTGEPAPAAPPASDVADVRLIIEDDEMAGGFVYTTIDRRTGAVIRQLPRDRLLKLSEASDYAAGALIKASA